MASNHEYAKIERYLKTIVDGFEMDRQLYLLSELLNHGSISHEYYKTAIEKVAITKMPFLKNMIEEDE